MRIHIIQHMPFETAGYLTTWANQPNNFVTVSRPYESEWYPSLESFDLCIVLGGSMSAKDTQKYPWLGRELDFLEKSVKKRKKMLGICLGAQLISRVLGGTVYQSLYREIGWHSLRLTPAAKSLPLFRRFPDSWTAFHWHKDTFSIPPMGYRIVETDGCANQGFLYEDHVMALQFNMESDVETVEALLRNCREDLVLGSYVQTEAEIRAGLRTHLASMHLLFEEWLNGWLLAPEPVSAQWSPAPSSSFGTMIATETGGP
jgi:GMP synthase-like glutamine amidotransferase